MPDPDPQLTVAAYGGGLNSTAMLVEWVRRGERLDLVLFADTGGEKPETYDYVQTFSDWLEEHGAPPVEWVREKQTLEAYCLERHDLPSLAYGHHHCSRQFKQGPSMRYLRQWEPSKAVFADGGKVVKLLGYDADEEHRATNMLSYENKREDFRFPLIEWEWGREECEQVIHRYGPPERLPPKSACFFCPASSKARILALPANLQRRAMAMEANATERINRGSVKGLGRNWSWTDLINANARQRRLWPDTGVTTCPNCYDG